MQCATTGHKERADENWLTMKTWLPEGTDLAKARAKYDHRFAALEWTSQTAEDKNRRRDTHGNVEVRMLPDAIPKEENERIQRLIDFSEYVALP